MKIKIILIGCLFLSSILLAQDTIDCEVIQCDCENISEADKKLGKEGLCKYLEKKMRIKCTKGDYQIKCQDNAKGPNAWSMIQDIEKIEKKTPVIIPNYTTVESILDTIKNSKNTINTYIDLHANLNALKRNDLGLELAIELSDLILAVHVPAGKINFALSFASYPSEYSEASIDLFLPRLVTGFSVIEELKVDQLDMKYNLGLIFNKLKTNGYDLNQIFKEGAHYSNPKVLSFIEDCDASVTTNYSKKELQDLRNVSSKIYLRKLNNLIPITHKEKLSRPIKLISDDILDWNESLIDISVQALELISNNIENKSWDKLKMKKLSLQYDEMYDEGVWNKQRYLKSLKLVTNELPIVWDLLKAIFLKK